MTSTSEQVEDGGDRDWWVQRKILKDGRCVYLHVTFFNMRISVSKDAEDQEVQEFYCFQNSVAAFSAMRDWDGTGDPRGWVRHIPSCRRRPDGDPEEEYIAP